MIETSTEFYDEMRSAAYADWVTERAIDHEKLIAIERVVPGLTEIVEAAFKAGYFRGIRDQVNIEAETQT